MTPKPQRFLVDAEGKRVGVVLDMREYPAVLEELDAVRAYDAAKASGEKPIPFEQAIQEIESQRSRGERSAGRGWESAGADGVGAATA
jgi:hypothetical protein